MLETSPNIGTALAELAESCAPCFQCGRCRSACPQGIDLASGPRGVVRMVLTRDLVGLLASEDAWRCSECGACTDACPMGVDVAAVLAGVRALQRRHGGPRCPERSAARIASGQIERHRRVDGLTTGLALAARGFFPRDPAGATALGIRSLRGRLGQAPRPTPPPRGEPSFFAGCALRADGHAYAATRALAAAIGVQLTETPTIECCGHPSRDPRTTPPSFDEALMTACPACERTLARSGAAATPVWAALVERARRGGIQLQALSPRFVPYAGCLSARDDALRVMSAAAELAGSEPIMDRPSLHGGCCGGVGGLYRTPTRTVTELLALANTHRAPIVTPCLLCRDVVRSAARRSRSHVRAYFWPEFFQAGPRGAASPPTAAANAGIGSVAGRQRP
ncbi:MAG TPA: 4Fe-4S dicluster domain-containing protein [Candidatus Binatia bacterium]|nr:4Fe-4S dicluster domain-containing protein [Candidatus Binatia bacterium]